MLLKYGMISMSDVRVAEIIRKVEEIYSVDIETVAPLDDDRLYNFNFLKSNTLDDVLDIIETIETDFGLPVVTSNQVTLWGALRHARVGVKIPRLGKLFTL